MRHSTPELLSICKNSAHVDRYRDVLAEFDHPRIVELGIFRGGSIAMLALIGDPKKLIAFDIAAEAPPGLCEFLAERGLDDVVDLHHGVDQADREVLTTVLDEALGGEPLDLVIDDASHGYGATRASFEILFPRLRSGGIYLIEDWAWNHIVAATMAAAAGQPADPAPIELAEPPLSQLAAELMLAMSLPNDNVLEVTVNENWIQVRKGGAQLDPEAFRLGDLYVDHFGLIP